MVLLSHSSCGLTHFNIFNMQYKTRVQDILVGLGLGRSQSDLFGDCSCTSIIIHHLLKELPSSIICSSAMDILHLIECNDDFSFNQVSLTIIPHSSCIILFIWLHFFRLCSIVLIQAVLIIKNAVIELQVAWTQALWKHIPSEWGYCCSEQGYSGIHLYLFWFILFSELRI